VAAPRIGVVGLNYWGPNLVRNFAALGELAWLCDLDPAHLTPVAERYPEARATQELDDLLADDSLDAVAIATPVPTHYALAKRALLAGKHVFVEKPPAMRAVEMDELVQLAEERDRVLMPGHLLLYHPAVLKLKELIDEGQLGDVLCVYGQRVNLGIMRTDENALWSLGVHDLSVILYLLDEDPELASAQGSWSYNEGVEDVVFCFLRFPSGKIAHMHLSWLDPHKMRKMTVIGREKMAVFDDMEPERKVTVYEKTIGDDGVAYTGDIRIPRVSTAEPLKLECAYFLELVQGRHDRRKVARDGARVVRALEMLKTSLDG
jgi:predicted dehydrogenase